MKISPVYEIENFSSKNVAREFVFKFGMCIFCCQEYERHVKLTSMHLSLWDCDTIIERIWDFEEGRFVNCYYDERHQKPNVNCHPNIKERFIIDNDENTSRILKWAESEFAGYIEHVVKLSEDNFIFSNDSEHKINFKAALNEINQPKCFFNKISINKQLTLAPSLCKLLDLSFLSYSIIEIEGTDRFRNSILKNTNSEVELNIHFKKGVSFELLVSLTKSLKFIGLNNIILVNHDYDLYLEDDIVYIGLANEYNNKDTDVYSYLTTAEFLALPLADLDTNSLVSNYYKGFTKSNIGSSSHESDDFDDDGYDDWQPKPKWNDFIEDAFDGEADAVWNID